MEKKTKHNSYSDCEIVERKNNGVENKTQMTKNKKVSNLTTKTNENH